jgi:hypothetical protein
MIINKTAIIDYESHLKNPLCMVKTDQEEPYETILSAGNMIGKYAIFEIIQASPWNKPCFCLKSKNKPAAFLKEVEDPHQHLIVKPLQRVPWNLCDEPVAYESTEALFEEIKQCLWIHLETPQPQDLTVITAFIMFTWIVEQFDTTPYLFFYGVFESGKSRALEMLKELCFRGWIASDITPANLYRPIESWKPTLLLDESETFISRPEVIGLLNSGYKRGLLVPRQVQKADGNFETQWYDLFSPKAIGGTLDLIRTTRSRCITFPMAKNTRKIPIFINKEQCASLRNRLLKWRFDMLLKGEEGEGGEPSAKEAYAEKMMEKVTSGRLIELFLPLYMTAPDKYKDEILKYAITINEQRNLELSVSEEVTVLQVVLECYNEGLIQNKLILVKNIAEKLNQQTDYLENWTPQRVGQIVSRIGFSKSHTRSGNALLWSNRLIKKLEADPRYKSAFKPIDYDDSSSLKPSPSSPPSPTFQEITD